MPHDLRPPRTDSLTERLLHGFAARGSHPAITLLDASGEVAERVSFDDLSQAVKQRAAALSRLTSAGDRVILLFPTGRGFIECFLACLYAGVIAVPLFPPRNQRNWGRLRTVLRDADPALILCPREDVTRFEDWSAREGTLTEATLVADDSLLDQAQACPLHAASGDTVALLQYTSGSTSEPKGVMVTHANLIDNLTILSQSCDLSHRDRMLTWLPHYHDMGLVQGLLLPLSLGAEVVVLSPAAFLQKPGRWMTAMAAFGATHSCAPNFAFDLAADAVTGQARLDLSAVRTILNGAEPIRAQTLDRFTDAFAPFGLRRDVIRPGYGMAETTLMVTDSRQGRYDMLADPEALKAGRLAPAKTGTRLVSSGRAAPGIRLRISDPETGAPCPPGQIGEIRVAGRSVAPGYWQQPGLSAEVFDAPLDGTPFLRTGDLGALTAEGELFVCGRVKDLIIIDGANHYPQDIETTAQEAHPALAQDAAAAVTIDEDGRQKLVLIQEVKRTERHGIIAQDVFRAVATAISEAHHLSLDQLVLLRPGAIPKTSSGKIQRNRARAALEDGTLAVLGQWPDPGKVEDARDGEWLATLIAGALGLQPADLSPDRPFAEYGLSSRVAVGLSGQIAERTGRDMPPTLLFDHPTLDKLRAHLSGSTPKRATRANTVAEPIAIVGMACRFPGADTLDQFWTLLSHGQDAVGTVPEGRWPAGMAEKGVPLDGGFLSDIKGFDAGFFGITPLEAERMDPQQRLLLEITWECLSHAHHPPERLRQGRTGVFVGLSHSDYGALAHGNFAALDAYSATGAAHSIAANRISYALDLRGPSVAVDTACSSSLVAVHQACRALQSGEAEMAIAAGVNLMIRPDLSHVFAQARMLSPSGRCRAFDAAADGYVRGEGAGAILLKPLSVAEADGDVIHAVIRGSAVGHGGRGNGLTAPIVSAQAQTIEDALGTAGLSPRDISFIEAHGTGTPLGDPIEVAALDSVFGARDAAPLVIGTVKSNIGHLEAAAGIAGLIKATLALKHRTVPQTLHLSARNPAIAPSTARVFATEPQILPAQDAPLRAGVSSFGFGGTNAHVVLEAAAVPPQPEAPVQAPALLALSAQTERALADVIAQAQTALKHQPLPAVAETLTRGRAALRCRAMVVADSADAAQEALSALPAPSAAETRPQKGAVFVFSGQGGQWSGMGRALAKESPAFATALARFDPLLREVTGRDSAQLFDDPALGADQAALQPALCALQMALSDVLEGYGVTPAAVVGHSLGEIAAASCAGAFPAEEAIRLAATRGALMAEAAGTGGLTVLNTSVETAEAHIKKHDLPLDIAAINGPAMVAVSGPIAALEKLEDALRAHGITVKRMPGTTAFHARALEPFAQRMPQRGGRLTRPMFSTVTGRMEQKIGPDYWARNMRDTVRFAEALTALNVAGHTHFIEIGPHPALTGLVRAAGGVGLPSLTQDTPGLSPLLNAIGRLFVDHVPGVDLVNAARPRGPMADLPAYPWERVPYWQDQHGATAQNTWHAMAKAAEQQAGFIPATLNLDAEDKTRRTLDALATTEMAECLARIDAGALPVDERFAPLVARWRKTLQNGAVAPAPDEDTAPQWLATYVARCHAMLPDILTGRESPLETLFPKGDWGTVEQMYHGYPVARYFNTIIAQAVAARAALATPSQPLRILEVGGGTGGLTRTVLPLLPADRVRYCFTDATAYFAEPMRHRLAEYPFVTFGTLDLDDPFDAQGYTAGSFDIILGANSVHAADHLDQSLSRLQSLLARDGVLMLYEATTPFAWLDTTVGLIEGWGAQKTDGRSGTPMVSPQDWQVRLQQAGFAETLMLPRADDPLAQLGQTVIIARSTGEARAEPVVTKAPLSQYALTWCEATPPPAGPLPAPLLVMGRQDVADALNITAQDDWPSTVAGWQALIAAYQPKGILLAPALDATGVAALEACLISCQALIHAQMAVAPDQRAALWILTSAEAENAVHTGLSAWARVAANEMRGMVRGMIALSDRPEPEMLRAALGQKSPDMLSIADGRWQVARFTEAMIEGAPVPIRSDGLYLMTGGLGVLGLRLAEEIAARGPGGVILASRSARADSLSAEARRTLDRLKGAGVPAHLLAVDCADEGALAAGIARITDETGFMVRGAVHCAGLLDAASLQETDAALLARSLHAKAKGADVLTRVLDREALDFLTFMGSAAATLCPPGTSAYAAANGYMDGVAARLRAQGVPAQTYHWGVWEDTGASAHSTRDAFRDMGLPLIAPDQGAALCLTMAPEGQMVRTVLSGSAADWLPSVRRWMGLPLLDRLQSPAAVSTEAIDETDTTAILRQEVARIMNLRPEQIVTGQPLVEQGLDSLMAIGLKGRIEAVFGTSLTVGDLMTLPSLSAIADRVAPTGTDDTAREVMSF
ncbi:acyl transferase domain-containing protein/acyl-CoA synthetase (AMP-forming)/AMP-acid ligase II/acyl carrier protein [Rubricella aquisinus]|uniref:Acyl transferase domain-containing protein/acyl-CoA synthetase (AMP-forming)/AMP-acid ligase II/acyl carrier protein n=1 Tax=Rubricella aquisinus TaxID=2028108 RepID=A0A840WUU3_9RHOB|nr:type I polyketide synthase [Rubricella aquisinus]MBB5514980.1 acyl transferase domain-containing protein/acyl-CoA synthetase (AMP-forming)/AMP-acid ligase II/acyl carrier protein [Rubricella aquisinus]